MTARTATAVILALTIGVIAACDDDDDAQSGGTTSGSVPGSDGGTSGSSGSSSAPTTASPEDVNDFCEKTLGVVIKALEDCCTAEDKEAQLYRLTHDLAALLEPQCTLTLLTSASTGRVLERSDRAAACYAAYADTYGPGKCANITRTFTDPAGTACREAFVGTVPEGAGCSGDHECVDGLTCVGYTGGADGHCVKPPAIGEACGAGPSDGGSSTTTSLEFGTHPACVDGAHCDDLTHKCVAGSTPTRAAEGAACTGSDGCAPSLYCDESKKCAKTKVAGQPCAGGVFSSECAGRCDAPSTGAGTCKTFCGSD